MIVFCSLSFITHTTPPHPPRTLKDPRIERRRKKKGKERKESQSSLNNRKWNPSAPSPSPSPLPPSPAHLLDFGGNHFCVRILAEDDRLVLAPPLAPAVPALAFLGSDAGREGRRRLGSRRGRGDSRGEHGRGGGGAGRAAADLLLPRAHAEGEGWG